MTPKSLLQIGLISLSLLASSCSTEIPRTPPRAKYTGDAKTGNTGTKTSSGTGKTKGNTSGADAGADETSSNPTTNTGSTENQKDPGAGTGAGTNTGTGTGTGAGSGTGTEGGAGGGTQTAIDQPPSTHMDAAFISSFIDEIAGPKGNGRGTGTPENKAVAQRIADEFKSFGLKPGGDNGTYFQAFSAKGKATQNIIGILPGETDEYIVMGAHMDHLGASGSGVFYGADDNASGTTGLVASAKAFAKNTVKLKRTLVFIAFSGEEMGLLGSIHYVKNATVDIKKVRFMVNTDMIGRYRQTVEAIGLEKTIEGNSIARELLGKTNLKPTFLGEVSAGGSDHMPFKDIGIPTGTFHTQTHAEYHKVGDTVEKIDKTALKTIAGVAADLAYKLAKSESITSSKFAFVPIEVDGYTDGIHNKSGCEPGLVSFEEVQSNLSTLTPLDH